MPGAQHLEIEMEERQQVRERTVYVAVVSELPGKQGLEYYDGTIPGLQEVPVEGLVSKELPRFHQSRDRGGNLAGDAQVEDLLVARIRVPHDLGVGRVKAREYARSAGNPRWLLLPETEEERGFECPGSVVACSRYFATPGSHLLHGAVLSEFLDDPAVRAANLVEHGSPGPAGSTGQNPGDAMGCRCQRTLCQLSPCGIDHTSLDRLGQTMEQLPDNVPLGGRDEPEPVQHHDCDPTLHRHSRLLLSFRP